MSIPSTLAVCRLMTSSADGGLELNKTEVEYIIDTTNRYNTAQQMIAMAIEERTK